MKFLKGNYFLGFLILLALLVAVVQNAFALHLLIMVFTSIAGEAWNIIGGYGGQLSFGHAAFYGIGAYTSTLLFVHLGVTPWLGMIAGGILAVVASLILGMPCFRLRGTILPWPPLPLPKCCGSWWFTSKDSRAGASGSS